MKKITAVLLLVSVVAQAQYFGQNKARYKTFDFKILQSPHFGMYNYFENPAVAKRLIANSEHWYKLHQGVFKNAFTEPNPIIIYKTHPDFQETTAISGQIGEGTGGVTEGFKNRVVMPVMYSHRQTDHVLGHELVHAFQYHTMMTGDSTSMASLGNLPLFMIEGLAEYMSLGREDSHTSMWMRDGVLNDDLPTIKDLVVKQHKYFPYRWGQAFWAYVAGTYGDDVIRPLFKESGKVGVEAAFINVLGIDIDRFSVKWKKAMTDYYTPMMVGTTKAGIGKVMASEEKGDGRMNISPAISPDGQYIAYISEKNVLSIDIYITETATGKVVNKINTSNFNAHVDSYSFIESAGTWSPDSRKMALVIQSKGHNKIMVIDALGKDKKVYDFGQTPESFTNPTWSPDGKTIVVCGLNDGVSDLYALDLASEKVKNLTNDDFSDLQPTYSPDGQFIYFVSDRNPKFSRPEKALFNISRLDVASLSIENYYIFPDADNLNPQIDPSGKMIYFISDSDGFRNLYRYTLADKKIEKLSNFSTGISGITLYSPAMSIAAKTGKVAYSQYFKGAYNLYAANESDFPAQIVDLNALDTKAGLLPPGELIQGRDIVQQNLELQTITAKIADKNLKNLAYKPKFKIDYIGSSGMGVGVTSTGRTGVQGGVQGIASDMLGNNQLMATIAANGNVIKDVAGQLLYLNQKKPLQWGFSASRIPYQFQGVFKDSLKNESNNIFSGFDDYKLKGVNDLKIRNQLRIPGKDSLVSNIVQLNRIAISQMGFFSFFPINSKNRFEAGLDINFYGISGERYKEYIGIDSSNTPERGKSYFAGREIELTTINKTEYIKNNLKNIKIQQVFVAFVGDNSVFGTVSPLDGYRYRFQIGQNVGSANYSEVLADIRKYHYLGPFSVAGRIIYNGRLNPKNADKINTFNPLNIGYPFYTHGLFYDNSSIKQETLQGDQLLVGNFEIRVPFTGPKKLALIEFNYLPSDLNFFVDAGSVSGSLNTVVNDKTSLPKFANPVVMTGLSLRINVMGYIIVEPYIAKPYFNGQFQPIVKGMSFMTVGW
jgi:Tol biopolymer transport system component